MRKIFYPSPYVRHKKQNLFVQSGETVAFGDKSLKILGPQIWNSYPEKTMSSKNSVDFKNSITKWFGPKCMCNCANAENRP